VAVCSENAVLRERISCALRRHGHDPVAVTDSVGRLLQAWPALAPELVVLACELEAFAPSREIAQLRAHAPGLLLVIVATGLLTGAARRVARSDVDGLVHETELETALGPTVDSVLAEQLCVPASLRDALARPVFSHREKQVLELVLAGLTNSEIAARLFLSESTVKSHLASSFRKLGVSSREEAARRALGADEGGGFVTALHGPGPTATPR
jgi:DNA-binding NarL/FixJ family response regulator